MEKAIFRIICLILVLTSATALSQGYSFDGQVLYHDNYPISGVNAYLHAPGGTIIDSTITDVNGEYSFYNLAPGDYTVTFTTSQPAGGVELSDAYLVMMKIMYNIPFSDIQMLAGDVNGSGDITWNDYYMIVIGYLNQGIPFPIGPWVFQTAQVTIPNASRDGFITRGGSSSGDVNGSLQPDPKSNPIFISAPEKDLFLAQTDNIEFNVQADENIFVGGIQLSLRVPDELEVQRIESPISVVSSYSAEGLLRITWLDESMNGMELKEGENMLTIYTKAKQNSTGNRFNLVLCDDSHLMNVKGEIMSGVKLSIPVNNITWQKDFSCSLFPNPFVNNAVLTFELPEESLVYVVLYDQTGRQVNEAVKDRFAAGYNQVNIDGSSFVPGIYFYTIKCTGNTSFSKTGAIIKSK